MIRKHNRSLTREQAFAQSVLSGNTGTVYFTTDSHTIIMNGVEYSKSDLKNLEGYFTDDNAKFNYRSTAGSQSVASQANGDLATIEALYGDSLVWNQLAHDTSFTNTDVDSESRRNIFIDYKTTSNTTVRWTGGDAAVISGIQDNTYYSWCKTAPADANGYWRIKVNGKTKDMHILYTEGGWQVDGTSVDTIIPNHVYYIRLRVKTCDSTTVGGVNIDNIQVFDLSLMFGLGKEPTLAEFETFLANYFPRKDYAYNEGEILSIKSNGIKTVGFNQLDWENYTFGGAAACTFTKNKDGFNVSITGTSAYIGLEGQERQWNLTTFGAIIPVLPNQKYCWSWEGAEIRIRVICFDKSKVNPPSGQWGLAINTYKGVPFTIPEGVHYICLRFMLGEYLTVGQTYNFSNFNLNLSWSGNRNGEYEEYWSETTPIPITTLEGTKSDGTREVMFPDGLCGIGDYKDEIKGNKAIKRIGKVDLSQFSWNLDSYTGDDFRGFICSGLRATIENSSITGIIRVIHSKYTATTAYNDATCAAAPDKSISQKPNGGSLFIKDSAYTSASAFKASLQGVYAYYVLAEPIEYTLDNEFKVDYKVDDYGTEEILPENGTAPTSLPIIADIRYGINAVDTLARLHKDYVSVYPQGFNDEQKEQARKNIGVDGAVGRIDFYTEALNHDSALLTMDVFGVDGHEKDVLAAEIPAATQEQAGVMSSSDKTKLDGMNVGNYNGRIVQWFQYPANSYASLAPYYDEGAKKTDTSSYFRALLRYLVDKVGVGTETIYIGRCAPNSAGFAIIQIYSGTNGQLGGNDNLPRYCNGVYFGINNGATCFYTNQYVWTWLTPVTGIKGNAESNYRQGNINLTPANLGITVVNNTADANKNVLSAKQDEDGNNIITTYAKKSDVLHYVGRTNQYAPVSVDRNTWIGIDDGVVAGFYRRTANEYLIAQDNDVLLDYGGNPYLFYNGQWRAMFVNVASRALLGKVKIGSNLNITEDGVISVDTLNIATRDYVDTSINAIPLATTSQKGLMSKEDKVLLGNQTTAIASDEARLDALDKTYETEGEFGFRHSGGSDIYDVNAGVGRITRLVGNSVNWHQLAPEITSENYGASSPTYTSLAFSTEQGRKIVTLTALQSANEGSNKISFGGLFGAGVAKYPANHYYFWTMDVMPSVAMTLGVGVSSTSIESAEVSSTTGYTRIYGRSHGDTEVSCRFKVISAVPQGATLKVKDIQMYDLTMMFGQGKEPTTAQMKTWLETYHRRYDYAREEKIIGFDPKEIVTQGSNLIFDNATVLYNSKPDNMDVLYKGDEITVKINTVGDNCLGSVSTGVIGATLTAHLQVNCIRVEPNTKYRISLDGEDADKVGRIFYNFLDATYKLLDTGNGLSYKNAYAPNLYFTTSAETYYVRIRLDFRNAGGSGFLDVGTYTFRVSLHKEGDGGKNDVVEKYWKKTKALTAPSTLKREDGSLIFPDGLMAIGDYKDEIVDGKAIKRIVKVDLGTLAWTKYTGNNEVRFYTKVQDSEDTADTGNIYGVICSKYTTTTYNQNYLEAADAVDKTIFITRGYYHLFIHDTTYDNSTAAEFKAAMSGVYAYYVLNDPEVIEIGDVYDDAYQVDPYGTEMMCDDANGNVDCFGTTKIKYGVDTAEDVGELFLAHANACATTERNGLMSAADKQSLDLNNTPLRLMVMQDLWNGSYNVCVSENAAKFINAGYKPVIYRRMKVKRHFTFNNTFMRVWKWIPCEEVILTPFETQGQQSAYMKIGVPNLLRRKHIVADTDTIYIGGSDIPISDWLNALGVWNYGSPSHLDDNNYYYAAKDFVIESCPDYIVDYSKSTHKYSQTNSYVYAHHGAARKTLYAGGSVLKAFKITLQYGFAFVEGSDITSKRVTDIIPFQLVHTPLENVSAVTSANKGLRWKFRLR